MNTKKLSFIHIHAILFNFVIVLALLAASLAIPHHAGAMGLAIEVNTTADNTTRDGLCSLREAITNANKNYQYYSDCTQGFDNDGIYFSNSLGTATIVLGSTLPAIKDFVGLTIDGGGDITINGSFHQAFYVYYRVPLTLDRLTVTRAGGFLNGGGLYSNGGFVTITNSTFLENSAYNGGGVYNNGGNLTITNSTFRGNGAGINDPGDNDGAGVYHNGGVLTITNSTFTRNGAYSEGGGVYIASGTTTVTNSTFSNNGNVFQHGSGIYANAGNLTINMSTFSNNTANLGAGVFVWTGTADITNSTFSGNSSNQGGGVDNFATTTIINSTFSGNSSSAGAGGGVSNGGTLYLYNTILANSTQGRDCFTGGGSVMGSNNLIESDSLASNACGLLNGVDGNIVGVDPALGALTGSPAYFPLNNNSPALGRGDDAICGAPPVNSTSQNGLTRPQGAHCEIGSFESPLQSLALSPQEQAVDLGAEIHGLVEAQILSEENGKSLTSMLDSFIAAVDKGDVPGGIEILNGFIEQANILLKSGELDADSGQSLVDKAQAIIESLNQEIPAE